MSRCTGRGDEQADAAGLRVVQGLGSNYDAVEDRLDSVFQIEPDVKFPNCEPVGHTCAWADSFQIHRARVNFVCGLDIPPDAPVLEIGVGEVRDNVGD